MTYYTVAQVKVRMTDVLQVLPVVTVCCLRARMGHTPADTIRTALEELVESNYLTKREVESNLHDRLETVYYLTQIAPTIDSLYEYTFRNGFIEHWYEPIVLE